MSSLGARRPLLERQIALRRELLRRQAKERHCRPGGLYEFVKYFWHVLEPKTPFVDGWAIQAICQHLEAVTYGHITRILINVPPGFSKALDDDTPVMTTWGWKRHGDLIVGDFVFGPDGLPKRVEAVSEPRVETGYEVLFDDGATIVASADHLWAVERDVPSVKPRYTRGRKPMVVATKDLVATGWKKESAPKVNWRPDRIPMCEPVKMAPKRLLVDPYILGAWLGDGATLSGILYAAEQDIEHFRAYGEITRVHEPTGARKQKFYRIRMEGVQERLRIMGVLGNKHIPDDYLEASEEQRWELLRGLMDTDGCATAEGHCTYTTKLHDLGEQIMRLCSSLGIKARISQQYSTINGEKFGPYSVINFTAPQNARLFKLDRKQGRVALPQNGRSRHRYVQSVTDVGTRTLRCIQVEGGIYLAGHRFVPTHNSMLTNCFWPAWEWGPMNMPHLRTLSFSYAVHLTERDNGKFKDLIKSPEYQAMYGDRFKLTADGVEKPANDKTGWKLASSIGGVSTGERGDRLAADDLHNVADGESDTIRSKTVRLFDEALSNRLNDLKKSAIVVIMQRVHENDVAGHIISHEEQYEHLLIPMEWDGRRYTTSIGWTDPRTEYGELAWPERYPEETLTRFRRNPFLWSGQYQQSPEPRGGGIFKRDWWQYEEVPIGKSPPQMEYIVASLDSAYTKNERNDPSGFTIWGIYRDKNGNPRVLLLHAWRKHLELHGPEVERKPGEPERLWLDRAKKEWGLVEWVAYDCKRLRVDRLLIEAKASGLSVAQEMQRLYANEGWGVELVDPEGDKYSRGIAVVHLWADGFVHVPASRSDPDDPDSLVPRDWAQMVIDEAAVFPNGRYRDLTDSATQALRHLRAVGLAVRREEREEERLARSMHREKLAPLYPT